ncbi:MAG: zf-HC2 domain-containing protein, partial [bacterium]
MKQDKNNEMDLLLRSLARSGRHVDPPMVSARENRALSDHLDADELNCFAEGVVPAPARARYIAHLADCESCRGFIVNLTQASGAAARYETLEQQTGSGFWRKMAALFSPPVLRYAVPALALTAVIAISFFALRQQRGPALVAQNQPANSVAPAYTNEQPAESPLAPSNTEGPATIRSGAESRAGVDSSSDKKSFQDDRNSIAQVSAEKSGAGVSTGSPLKDSAQSKQGYVAGQSRPIFAPEPQAVPPPAAKPALREADKTVALQKEELARREAQEPSPEEEKNQPRDEAGRHGPSRSNVSLLPGSKRPDGLMTERGEPKARNKKD